MNVTNFSCFLVEKDNAGKVRRGIAQRSLDYLPPGMSSFGLRIHR